MNQSICRVKIDQLNMSGIGRDTYPAKIKRKVMKITLDFSQNIVYSSHNQIRYGGYSK